MLAGDSAGENLSGQSSEEKSVLQVDIKEVNYSLAVIVLAVNLFNVCVRQNKGERN